MKDIDFDELDKAVSSLMGKPDSESSAVEHVASDDAIPDDVMQDAEKISAPEESKAATDSEPETTTEAEIPEAAEVNEVSTSDADEVAADDEPATEPAPKIVTRPRGKFMDVVRTPAGSTSRSASVSSSRAKSVVKPSASFEKDYEENIKEASEPEQSEDAVTSPFLPDAKVEKRPLGSPASDTPSGDEAEAVTEAAVDKVFPETETYDQPEAETVNNDVAEAYTPVPEELSSDILNVELGGAPDSDEIDLEALDLAKPVDEKEEPSAPSSIPQQYKTVKSAEGDEERAPLFDAAPAPAKPAKASKRSGLKVFLLLIILLIIGCAAGYALYTFNVFR